MKLCVFDIPESTADLADWLEGHLVGPDLGNLVQELAAIHGTEVAVLTGGDEALDAALAAELPGILQQGLRSLSRAQLQTLLRSPALLLELQEEILSAGGGYWEEKWRKAPDGEAPVQKAWDELQSSLARPLIVPTPVSRWIARIMVALAATVLVAAVGFYFFGQREPQVAEKIGPQPPKEIQPPQVAQKGWGWNSPDAFPQHLDARSYLAHLADAADEWFKKRPENREDLAKRITQFRKGCDTLLQAEHKPLAAADKAWLLERCRIWSGKLEQHLADLNAGKDVLVVRAEADATVQKLVQALRTRFT